MTIYKLFLSIKRLSIFICIVAFSVFLTVGCSRKEGDKAVSKDEKEKSPVVAQVGANDITAADLRAYVSKRPVPHQGQASREAMEKRLDELILQEVLYQEALRLNLDQDPEMRQRIRQMLTQKLMDEEINQKQWKREISEAEVKEYYEQHWSDYNRPAQVRVADIFILVPPQATKSEKEALQRKAETVLAEAVKVKEQRTGFGSLVRKYSDEHPKYRKGDTGFFDMEGQPIAIDKQLAEEAFKLERVGDLADKVVTSPDGYHVIMLIGKRQPMSHSLETVKNQIEQRVRRESVSKARQDYVDGLKAAAKIKIDGQELDKVVAELSKPKPESIGNKPMVRSPMRPGSVEKPPPLNR